MGALAIGVFYTFVTFMIDASCSFPAHLLYEDSQSPTSTLAKGDEVSSGEIDLTVPVVFYGQTFSTIYVNSNGLLSLTTEIPHFFNIEFPLDYPAIAPLYSNIDTTFSGTITYQETRRPDLLARANENIHDSFAYSSEFFGTNLFIVTWRDVGYHGNGTDKVNTFQAAICTNGDDSYVEFLYPDDGIQWIQGVGDESGLPDARAQVGFVSPDGRYFALRGSGTDQIQNLNVWSNMNLPGQWIFRIGRLQDEGNVEEPDINNDLFQTPVTSCNQGSTLCHSRATCEDHVEGFCCVCQAGFYGNGKLCVKNDVPLRVNGKVSGKVNGEKFENLDLQSYVVMSDARAYTAISKIPESIGYDAQTLQILGALIGWLFAKPVNGAINGYQLTGGLFNHTATITFHNTSNTVTVRQKYLGLDVFDQGKLEANIQGDIPNIPLGANLIINGYEEQYTMTKPGVIQSLSKHQFKYIDSNKEEVVHIYTVDQTILFDSCVHGPMPIGVTWRLKVGKNFINYEATEQLIRFGLSNKVVPLGEFDPCKEAVCGRDSSCVVEGDSFRCLCNPGFQYIYHDSTTEPRCEDVNECQTGTHDCDYNAQCANEIGGYRCACNPGFEGNGKFCQNAVTCSGVHCNENAQCVVDGYARCKCLPGFSGNGHLCVPVKEHSCHLGNNCHPYAVCTISPSTNRYDCVCLPGYVGNGYECERRETEEDTTVINEPAAATEEGPKDGQVEETCMLKECWCPQGYVKLPDSKYCSPHTEDTTTIQENETDEGARQQPIPQCLDNSTCFCPSGYHFIKRLNLCIYILGVHLDTKGPSGSNITCNVVNNCHHNGQCVQSPENGEYKCRCNEGFDGDGFECYENEVSCLEADICDVHAICEYNETIGKLACMCNEGFKGDGMFCSVREECTRNEECPENEECKENYLKRRYECDCKDNFVRDAEGQCKELQGTCGGGTCVEHAECLFDDDYQTFYCQCIHEYVGDGITECKPRPINCNERNNCDVNANCIYDLDINDYACKCNAGYHGDGNACSREKTCAIDPDVCDPNARCVRSAHRTDVCECIEGYTGNGTICIQNPKHDGNFLLVNQGMTTLRVPFEPTPLDRGKPIQMKSQQMAIGLAIDCLGGRVYWSDIAGKAIRSSTYNGSMKKDFLTADIGSPEGISIDWVSRNIYWTDSTKDTIEVVNIETLLRRTLFSTELVNPRGIAVHPQRGKLFWCDWDRRKPKIEWANSDGTARQIFLTGDDVVLPNSLAIDWETDEICYADAGTHKIECLDIDTRAKRTIATNCSYPFGLAISDRTYYWTDWESKKIERVEKQTMKRQNPLNVPLGGSGNKLYGLAAAPEKCPPLVNVCQSYLDQCPRGYLCLPTGTGTRRCVCAVKGNSPNEIPSCNDV